MSSWYDFKSIIAAITCRLRLIYKLFPLFNNKVQYYVLHIMFLMRKEVWYDRNYQTMQAYELFITQYMLGEGKCMTNKAVLSGYDWLIFNK